MSPIQQRLSTLSPQLLTQIRRGIEKESLRVRSDGTLAMTPHPPALGSPLTHPHITTDFSESQLELITGAHPRLDDCLAELTRVHQFVYRNIGDELLWASSMPCNLPADDEIPIGRYGRSNVGRMKTIYRTGLSYRYGRRMQTISGIHYNFSLPNVGSEDYFALIRNFRRHSWLALYLFGASPAVCSTFVAGRKHQLQELRPGTMYLPYATSLRMGRLGYQSDAQAALCVSYNSLDSYAASLDDALTQPFPAYEKIGLREKNTEKGGENDEYKQLNTSLLQIENEFYSTVRPKRRIRPGERPLHALRERGVEYVEVRLMDLDPFDAIGINAPTMRLLDVFLLHCLLSDSPPDTPREIKAIGENQHRVAAQGREPGLKLNRNEKEILLSEWGKSILAECEPIAAALDAAHGGAAHGEALSGALRLLGDADLTPSARVLHAMARNHDNVYVRFALAQSLSHAGSLRGMPWPADQEQFFEELTKKSIAEQLRIEAADTLDFEAYRKKYLAHDTLIIGQPRYREDR
jgi:glutamate--cysteine ligase